MISVDDIVKLILVISVSFSIVIIAWQLARLIGAAVGLVNEIEETAKNVSEGSDMVLDDYRKVRGVLDMLSGLFNNVAQIKTMLEGFSSILGKDEKEKKKSAKPPVSTEDKAGA